MGGLRGARLSLGMLLTAGAVLVLAPVPGRTHEPRKRKAAESPLHADPVVNRALLAWQGGNPDKAATILRKAVREKPDAFDHWAYLGRLQLERGEDGPHILRFGNQVSARPLDDQVDVDAWRREKLSEALGCFEKLVELRPGYAVGYGYQVICLLGLERLGEAESVAREAVRSEPEDPSWGLQLAAVLRMNGKLEESAVVLNSVEQVVPRSASLHQERFRLAQARGEAADELEALRLRAVFFTYLIPQAISEFMPERGRITERFGGGRSGVRAPEDVEATELLDVLNRQAMDPDDFAHDLWISVLHHDNHEIEVTEAAARSLEATGQETSDRLFWVLLNTPDSSTAQLRVARMLARRKDGRILEPLCRFLPHDVDMWPVEAATALGMLGDPGAVSHLAAVSLGNSADGSAPPPKADLGTQLNRRRCVESLRNFDTPESTETLEKLLGDPPMRGAALASLYHLRHDPGLLDQLAAMLRGRKADFRAVHDLAQLDDDRAWQIVLDRGTGSDNEQVRAHTARAIRYATATEAQRPAFLDALEKLRNDPARVVVQEAERGLEKLQAQP